MTTGFLTINNLIELKLMSDAKKILTEQLSNLIEGNLVSEQKQNMAQSVRYYDTEHDIKDATRTYYRDGKLITNSALSNNVVSHPFHTNLVNHKADYIARNPLTMGIAGEAKGDATAKAFRTVLINELDEKFDAVVYDWILGASQKGFECVHFYVDTDGDLNYCIVPAEQCIPIYDTQYQNKLVTMIRFYGIDFIDAEGKEKKRYKVEIWNKDTVEYFEQDEEGSFFHDGNYALNPAPHWTVEFSTEGETPTVEKHSWGRVPFVVLANNSRWTTDLKPIKALIDAYDKVKNGFANDIEDFQEVLYVVKGFSNISQESQDQLSELAMFVKNIREDRAVAVEEDGDVTTLKAEIPVQAKETFLAITTAEIFYFGEGVSLSEKTLGVSHAPSGVALKFLYAPLDMKADRLILKLKLALKDFVWFVTSFINARDESAFDSKTVTFTVNKGMIFNEAEKVASLVAVKSILSKQTLLEQMPYVEDVEGELQRIASDGHFEDAPKEVSAPATIV